MATEFRGELFIPRGQQRYGETDGSRAATSASNAMNVDVEAVRHIEIDHCDGEERPRLPQ